MPAGLLQALRRTAVLASAMTAVLEATDRMVFLRKVGSRWTGFITVLYVIVMDVTAKSSHNGTYLFRKGV
jgi:hypothetical protein